MAEKRIYIADDEPNIRQLISAFLSSEGYGVKEFATGDALLAAFLADPADMVILDVMMPGTDGLAVCTAIRKRSNVPIIIVSARDSEMDRITGITLGSDDYLTKPFSPMELVARVKAIFRRLHFEQRDPAAGLLRFGDLEISTAGRQVQCQGAAMDLTPTEFTLTVYLAENAGRAVSREELLKNVWQYDFEVDTRATDDVIKRLRKKLSACGSRVKITSVWGFGFKLEQEAGNETD